MGSILPFTPTLQMGTLRHVQGSHLQVALAAVLTAWTLDKGSFVYFSA